MRDETRRNDRRDLRPSREPPPPPRLLSRKPVKLVARSRGNYQPITGRRVSAGALGVALHAFSPAHLRDGDCTRDTDYILIYNNMFTCIRVLRTRTTILLGPSIVSEKRAW